MTGAKTLGILFSNEGEKALGDLTLHRTPGAIPFGGRYRLVDFVHGCMGKHYIRYYNVAGFALSPFD